MGNSDLSQCWQSMCYHDLFIPWFILSSLCQYAIMGCSYYSLRLHNMGCSDSSLCQCVIITLIKKERKIQISFENKCDRCECCLCTVCLTLSLLFPLIFLSRAVQATVGVVFWPVMPVAVAAAARQEVCVWVSTPSPVVSAGMNMPLHQISVIPRDVTSSRVSGSGKSKDKQVGPKIMVF